MTCPKCGRQVNDRTAFCPHCGFRVQNVTRQPNRPAAPQRQSAPAQTMPSPKQSFQLLKLGGDITRILCYAVGASSLVAMILWLCIGFTIDIGLTSEKFSLYTYFFKQSHTTFLTVFVVLGLLANIAFTILPCFIRIPHISTKAALKIALQSIAVSNLLGMLSLHAALATSEHELLSYMNFPGWTCFIFMLASLVVTVILFWQTKNKR